MYSIGVDFHKAYSHMTVLDGQGQMVKAGKVAHTADALRAFVAPYRDGGQAVVEATRTWTIMYDLLETELDAVYLAHPLKVRAIAEARIKTDRIDSRFLAHLLRCDLLRRLTCDRRNNGSPSRSCGSGCSSYGSAPW
jgi:transposase